MAQQRRTAQTDVRRSKARQPTNRLEPPAPFPNDVILPSEIDAAVRLHHRIVRHVESLGFAGRDLFAIRLALEEGLINAVKHGNRLDRNKQVRVAYCVHEDCFYVRIRDEGPGFDPTTVPDPTLKENIERPSGRGLLLMKHFMSEVHYLDEGTTLLMWKRRNGR